MGRADRIAMVLFLGTYQNTLGVAQDRVGDYPSAIETLYKSHALNADAPARSEASGRWIIRKCEPEKRGAVQWSQQDVENKERG